MCAWKHNNYMYLAQTEGVGMLLRAWRGEGAVLQCQVELCGITVIAWALLIAIATVMPTRCATVSITALVIAALFTKLTLFYVITELVITALHTKLTLLCYHCTGYHFIVHQTNSNMLSLYWSSLHCIPTILTLLYVITTLVITALHTKLTLLCYHCFSLYQKLKN